MPFELIATFLLTIGLVVLSALLIASIRKDRQKKQQLPTDPARKPFPQHSHYADSNTFPKNTLQTEHDATVLTRYQQWRKQWVLPDLEPGRSFLRMGVTKQALRYRMLVTSEGQGLAMLCTVLFAGADVQTQGTFDQLFAYCKAHPSQKHPDLMSWTVIAEAFPSIATDSATRGDLLIAYALLMADQQWGSEGKVNYLAQGKAVIQALKEQCVHPESLHMLQGNWVSEDSEAAYQQTSASCVSPLIFKAFYKASADRDWLKVSARMRGLLRQSLQAGTDMSLPDVINVNNNNEDSAVSLPEDEGTDAVLQLFHQLQAYWFLADDETRDMLTAILGRLREADALSPADGVMASLADAMLGDDLVQVEQVWDGLAAQARGTADSYTSTWQLMALVAMNQNLWALG